MKAEGRTNESPIKIRRARSEDAQILADIGRRSFNEAFAEHPKNHPDDMRAYMNEAFSIETIESDLADAKTVYLIAEFGGEAAGYAKLAFDARETGVSGERLLELCRLYALDRFIGKGVGKSLMLEIFKIAEETNRDAVWLGVWEYNFRAQKFYEKFGFEKCGEHVFQLGSDPQIDWVLQRKLTA